MRKFALVAAMVLVSAGAQAGQSRGLSLAGSDKSVQETKAVEPAASVVDAPRAPRAADASGATETTNSIDRSKFTERPPGVDISRRSRMQAAASQRRAASQTARADIRWPQHRGWSAARIVATLHHYGIYW